MRNKIKCFQYKYDINIQNPSKIYARSEITYINHITNSLLKEHTSLLYLRNIFTYLICYRISKKIFEFIYNTLIVYDHLFYNKLNIVISNYQNHYLFQS